MAINRLRGAFQVPKKGETFELRAGLVYETPCLISLCLCGIMLTGLRLSDPNMHTNGTRADADLVTDRN